jgi:hypothetical protein
MRASFLHAVFVFLLFASDGQSQEAPTYSRPPTQKDCATFRDEYWGYIKSISARVTTCLSQNDKEATFGAQVRIACYPITVPKVCASEIETRACAIDKSGSLINECMRQARDDTTDPSRQALLDPAAGVPMAGARNTLRMANLLFDRGDTAGAKALLTKSTEVIKYSKAARRVMTIYDSTQPPEKRVEALALMGTAIIKNPLAKDMSDLAVRGLVTTNRNAMDALTRELSNLSNQVSKSEIASIEAKLATQKREIENAIIAKQHEAQAAAEAENQEQERQAKSRGIRACIAENEQCNCNGRDWNCVKYCGAQNIKCLGRASGDDEQTIKDRIADSYMKADWDRANYERGLRNAYERRRQAEDAANAANEDAAAFVGGVLQGFGSASTPSATYSPAPQISAPPRAQTPSPGGGGGKCSSVYANRC